MFFMIGDTGFRPEKQAIQPKVVIGASDKAIVPAWGTKAPRS